MVIPLYFQSSFEDVVFKFIRFLIWPTDTLAPFCLQPDDLAVCCDAIHQGLHQMCVFCRVDPAGQLAVRNDNKASFFIEKADCAVK